MLIRSSGAACGAFRFGHDLCFAGRQVHLPRLEAIVISLADNLALFKLEKHGGMRPHFRPSSKRSERDSELTNPEDF